MSDTYTKKIVKDNTVIQEVWVTHWDLYGWGPHVESVSLRPWETDYSAPITKYADNTRFVNADYAQAKKEAAITAADKLAERSRRIIDGYCFTADGNDTWLEVVAVDLAELETALAEYEATKEKRDG